MTAPSPLRCLCSHSQWRHLADSLVCRSGACGCTEYRPLERGIPARFDERYDPSPEPIDRRIS